MKSHSPATTSILNGEAGLAGIQLAVQGRPANRLLHQRLDAMLQPGSRAARLELTRVKYKPGRRLSAYYTAQIGDPTGERAREVPFVITWGGDLTPQTLRSNDPSRSGKREEDQPAAVNQPAVRQMEEEAGRRGLLAPFTRLQSEDNGALLQVWPLDSDFPQLARLSDPDNARALFESARVPLPSDCVKINPIRYRPGERHVLRYKVETAAKVEDLPCLLYAKLYREHESAARAARITNRAADWLDTHLNGFHAVRPEGVSLEDAAILYPHAEGKPLSQQLRRSPEWLGRQLRLVGAVLEALHQGPPSLAEELEANTLEKEVKVIRRASEHVQVLLPQAGSRILSLLDRALERAARLSQEPPAFTHSDFKADHLLISRSGMALIDFDTCALADPALDVGKFLADLEWWHDLTRTPGVELAQAEFLKGYPSIQSEGRRQRARVYHALILVKIAIRRTRLYWRDWAATTERLVARAEKVLEEIK